MTELEPDFGVKVLVFIVPKATCNPLIIRKLNSFIAYHMLDLNQIIPQARKVFPKFPGRFTQFKLFEKCALSGCAISGVFSIKYKFFNLKIIGNKFKIDLNALLSVTLGKFELVPL